MKFENIFRKLYIKFSQFEAPHKRKFISKLLIKLPKSLFPNYRVIVNPVIITSNRRTLNITRRKSDSSSESDSWYSSFSSISDEETRKSIKKRKNRRQKCCKHCRKVYRGIKHYINDSNSSRDSLNKRINDLSSTSLPRSEFSDVISDDEKINIPEPPPLPPSDFLKFNTEDFVASTPQKRITTQDLGSVKLRPSTIQLKLPRTPEVHDMMQVLRKRFAAMHSPLQQEDYSSSDTYDEDPPENYYNSNSFMKNGNMFVPLGIA
ncbi:uncharacterized protein LOC115882867 [Sitophilus oryzae]|uniref:Uncharacterized protein LOC115882867 n=1 Tax=Sitophilus oryzae TaxID=7048 RepID=A0A6J2Y241_SITOR|nr:uncharacterized protein LOC115882867 [Sitophilus oryzae]